ncbi:hypothetical protein ACR42D_10070 [Desulfovibrio caledoniensis]
MRMKDNMPVAQIIDRLKAKYGNHTNAGCMLGYKHSSGYRRARREALKRGEFPGPTHRLALLLVSDESRGNAA